MRQSVISSLILGVVLNIYSWSALAQTSTPNLPVNSAAPVTSTDVYFINRAKNLARQAAITANGGLERYRPDPTMFGPAIQTQYARNSDGSITFSFTGSTPGKPNPSLETVATVAPNGTVKLDYNGPLRNIGAGTLPAPLPQTLPAASQPPILPSPASPPLSVNPSAALSPTTASGLGQSPSTAWADDDAFFSRARNLARQAAIKANGGLARYRPEAAMFGPSAATPAVKNSDGSITFTLKGGAPNATALTTESVVTVNPTGKVNLDYNGPIR